MDKLKELYNKSLEIEKENKLMLKYGKDYSLGRLFEDIKEKVLKENYDSWFLINENTELNDLFVDEKGVDD